MNALHKLGVTDATNHFIVISQSQLNEDGINVAVLTKKSEFTPEEEAMVRQHIAKNPADAGLIFAVGPGAQRICPA